MLPGLKPILPPADAVAIQTAPVAHPPQAPLTTAPKPPTTSKTPSSVTAMPPGALTTARSRPEVVAVPVRGRLARTDDDEDDDLPEKAGRRARRGKKRRSKQGGNVALWAAGGAVLFVVLAGLAIWAATRGPKADAGPTEDDKQARVEPKKPVKPPDDDGVPDKDAPKDKDRAKEDDPPKEIKKEEPKEKPKDDPRPDPVKPPATATKPNLSLRLLSSTPGHKPEANGLMLSSDGQRVFSFGQDALKRWTLEGEKLKDPALLLRSPGGHFEFLAVSPDGKRALTKRDGATIQLWQLEGGKSMILPGHSIHVSAGALSPDGTRAVTVCWDKVARVWDAQTGKLLGQFKGHEEKPTAVRFMPDSKRVLTGGFDATLRLWDVETGAELHVFQMPEKRAVEAIAVSPDTKSVMTWNGSGMFRLWDLDTGLPLRQMEKSDLYPRSYGFSPDGSLFAAYCRDGVKSELCIWDVETGQQRGKQEGDSSVRGGIVFTDTQTLMGSGSDGSLRLWRIESGSQPPAELAKDTSISLRQIMTAKGHQGKISGISVTRDRRVVSTAWDGTVRVWNLEDGMKLLHVFEMDKTGKIGLHGVALSPDQKSALVNDAMKLQLIDLDMGQPRVKTPMHGSHIRSFVISPDGTLGVSGCDDNTAHVWNLKTGREVKQITGHAAGVKATCFLPDSKRFLAASGTMLFLWEASTGKFKQRFDGHTADIESMALTPDGKCVVSGGWDKTVRVWEVANGRELYRLKDFPHYVNSMAISPDGRLGVASAYSGPRPLRFWDMATGNELMMIDGPKGSVENLTFSPDGKYLLCNDVNDNGVVCVLEVSLKPARP